MKKSGNGAARFSEIPSLFAKSGTEGLPGERRQKGFRTFHLQSNICSFILEEKEGIPMDLFHRCLKEQIPVEIIYLSEKGEWTKRIVLPRKLDGGAVLAFDLSKGGIRRFRMDRIFAALPAAKANKRKFPTLIA